MWVEVILGVVCLFLLLNLVLSWINLNVSFQMVQEIQHFLDSHRDPSNLIGSVSKKINDIESFLSELLKIMGNPFQMLAATHGQRILDRFFPAKNEFHGNPAAERGQDSLLSPSPSGEAWQEKGAEENQHQDEEEAQP